MVYYIVIANLTDTIRLTALLHLLLPHDLALRWRPLVLRTIANTVLIPISSQSQLLAQLAFDGLEAAHFPVLLLLVLPLLRDQTFSLSLKLSLNLVHLSKIVRVIVLGHGFAGQRRQDSTHV